MAVALEEAARVVRPDGVVTVVFGHGDPTYGAACSMPSPPVAFT